MTLGEKLREARKQANLSQEQLAEQICVSRSAVAKWESDLGHPDIENLRELAQLFNLSMDVLTDDALSLEDAAARNSALTCCGKSCEGCTHRESFLATDKLSSKSCPSEIMVMGRYCFLAGIPASLALAGRSLG